MSSEKELLAFLKEEKLNVTQQRLEIANIFLSMPGHHTLEEIYLAVRNKTHTVGQTTVYRTIRLLCKAGLAREVLLDNGSSRYESNLNRKHHDHLMCLQCGKIIEFVNNDIERIQHEIANEAGFELQGHNMILFGRCPTCRANEQNDNEAHNPDSSSSKIPSADGATVD